MFFLREIEIINFFYRLNLDRKNKIEREKRVWERELENRIKFIFVFLYVFFYLVL